MKLSEMRQLLADRGVQLTKSLGQNFLHDGNQLQRIVAAARLAPGERVLEIGPGLGPLTELLLTTGATVRAIEKDARLVALLRERLGQAVNLTLVHGDGLDEVRARSDWRGWKMVSNLPYSVASPLLVELAQAAAGPDCMVVTLQWEVAQRLLAPPDGAEYGLLTLLVQLEYVPGDHFKIPASCFHPAPDVDSACLVLHRRAEPALAVERRPLFRRIVKRAFGQRRKMMFKLLKQDYPAAGLEKAFAELGLAVTIRAEAVALEQFVRLTEKLATSSCPT
jgi:16S rRNA (adenine1518-N6/adenine1519-N6)-dimethyltransferase